MKQTSLALSLMVYWTLFACGAKHSNPEPATAGDGGTTSAGGNPSAGDAHGGAPSGSTGGSGAAVGHSGNAGSMAASSGGSNQAGAAAVPKACGDSLEPCAAGEWCDYAGDRCEGPAVCRPRPSNCSADNCIFICGCDNEVYCDPCAAQRAGTDIVDNPACGFTK